MHMYFHVHVYIHTGIIVMYLIAGEAAYNDRAYRGIHVHVEHSV